MQPASFGTTPARQVDEKGTFASARSGCRGHTIPSRQTHPAAAEATAAAERLSAGWCVHFRARRARRDADLFMSACESLCVMARVILTVALHVKEIPDHIIVTLSLCSEEVSAAFGFPPINCMQESTKRGIGWALGIWLQRARCCWRAQK